MSAPSPRHEALLQQTHIWYLDPDAPIEGGDAAALHATLSAREQAQYRRFHSPCHAQRYLLSHAMLRQVLSHYVATPPAELAFRRGPHGKPGLAPVGTAPLEFNLTHTVGLAACVVTRGRACGIDAEQLAQRRDPLGVARRMFSAAEVAELARLEGPRRLEYFYTRWTLREAYVKARGLGLSFPMRRLQFALSDESIDLTVAPELNREGQDWDFRLLRPRPDHLLAVAEQRLRAAGSELIVREWRFDAPGLAAGS